MDRPLPESARVERDPRRDTIRFLKGENLSADLGSDPAFAEAARSGARDALALAFVTAHRSAFRLEDPPRELVATDATTDALGTTHVKLEQVFRRIPIVGAGLIVHIDESGAVYLVNGSYVPTPAGLDTTARVGTDDALRAATSEIPSLEGRCDECTLDLVIFPGAAGPPKLAWRIGASPSPSEGWELVIDAQDGTVLRRLPTVYDAGGLRRK